MTLIFIGMSMVFSCNLTKYQDLLNAKRFLKKTIKRIEMVSSARSVLIRVIPANRASRASTKSTTLGLKFGNVNRAGSRVLNGDKEKTM